jgi:hypothetical protein
LFGLRLPMRPEIVGVRGVNYFRRSH